MSQMAGFSIEDIMKVTGQRGGTDVEEPKVEQMVSKLQKLQQVQRDIEEEIKTLQPVLGSLQTELETAKTEAFQLDGIQKEKEELYQKLQFQCDESERDVIREVEHSKKTEGLLEQYRCELQEFKLKQRKQRITFENHLHQLMEQHKILYSVFTPERIPAEMENVEKTTNQLLLAEEQKLAQLHRLDEMLEEIKKQQQPEQRATESTED